MGSIDIFKALPTLLSSVVNKSEQHQEKNCGECQESNRRLLGEKQICYLCAMQPPEGGIFFVFVSIEWKAFLPFLAFQKKLEKKNSPRAKESNNLARLFFTNESFVWQNRVWDAPQ